MLISKLFPNLLYTLILGSRFSMVFCDVNVVRYALSFFKNLSIFKFTQLLDIWVVDYPNNFFSFEVNYMLLSPLYNKRMIVSTYALTTNFMFTVSDLFFSAVWLEREIFDMFGVISLGNIDLSRMLTDYGFRGYPLRKDFPLSGYVEVRYDEMTKAVLLEPVELSQDFRYFQFSSPWDNIL